MELLDNQCGQGSGNRGAASFNGLPRLARRQEWFGRMLAHL
jgi:hypothetical protein